MSEALQKAKGDFYPTSEVTDSICLSMDEFYEVCGSSRVGHGLAVVTSSPSNMPSKLASSDDQLRFLMLRQLTWTSLYISCLLALCSPAKDETFQPHTYIHCWPVFVFSALCATQPGAR